MARRSGWPRRGRRSSPRPRNARALGLCAVVAAAVLAGALVDPVSRAQPAPDLEHAKQLYLYAEGAMKEGRFEDAVRDYGASYELSKDPALFFKIGRANERAGKCDVALTYYARYLHDGKPIEQFVAATRERMRACGGDVRDLPAGATPVEPRPGSGSDGGSAGAPVEGSAPAPGSAAPPQAGSAATGSAAAGSAAAGSGAAGSAAAGSAAAGSGEVAAERGSTVPVLVPSNGHKIAWIMTGGAVALATLGGVLAYAATSSESDVRDLYVGFAGQPATFNAETRKKYDDLVDQGHRFQHLSWASFGLAGAAAAGAAVLFVLGGHREAQPHARVTPIVTPTGAGVAIGF